MTLFCSGHIVGVAGIETDKKGVEWLKILDDFPPADEKPVRFLEVAKNLPLMSTQRISFAEIPKVEVSKS